MHNIANAIVLDFELNLFFQYLWHDLLTLNDVVACSRLPRRQICWKQISLQLETWINTTMVQLVAVELRSKVKLAILAN